MNIVCVYECGNDFWEAWTDNCFDKISKMNKYAKSSRSGNYSVTAAIEIFI